MKTFEQTYNDYLTLTKDSSSSNTTLGKSLINTYIRRILRARDWTFNRSSATDSTVADQQNYPKPYNCKTIRFIKVEVDDTDYWPTEVKDRGEWILLNRSDTTSDIPQRFFVEDNEYLIYPIPASDGNTITVYYNKNFIDLSQDNYTTGTVSVSAGSTSVTGSSTVWTSSMVGRYIKFDDEGIWYEITAVSNNTSLTIAREAGTTISSGTYVIGELIPLPDDFEDLPLWGAVGEYYLKENDQAKATYYLGLYKDGYNQLLARDTKVEGNIIDKHYPTPLVDPNDYPTDLS